MASTGRPSSYTKEIAEKICDLIAVGRSSRQIAAVDGMPSRDTIFRWIRTEDGFSDQYAKARMAQAAFFVDEIIEIADDVDGDPARDRLRLDTRKWAAGKYAPKVFGDAIKHEHTGKDGEALRIVIEDVADTKGDSDG